jgi:hypothetical protein
MRGLRQKMSRFFPCGLFGSTTSTNHSARNQKKCKFPPKVNFTLPVHTFQHAAQPTFVKSSSKESNPSLLAKCGSGIFCKEKLANLEMLPAVQSSSRPRVFYLWYCSDSNNTSKSELNHLLGPLRRQALTILTRIYLEDFLLHT